MVRHIGTLITALLILLLAGSAMCATYDDYVDLVEKDSDWNVVEGGANATVQFNTSGEEFDFSIEATGLQANESYCLIYYADRPDRFSPEQWGGDNPGALIDNFTTDTDGNITYQEANTELDMNLPHPNDYNIYPDPWDEYCSADTDNYDNCCGAKLWIVPCDDYNTSANKVTNWNPTEFLFETDLIWYDDTGHNLAPEIDDVWSEYDENAAGDTINITAVVCDEDGSSDLDNMIVTANFSDYGVEELVVLEMVDCEEECSCICAEYTGSVIINVATEVCGEVVATDPTELEDTADVCFYVVPGDCAYMELQNYEYDEDDLRTKALTHLWDCNTCPVMWWCDYEMFDIYMLVYSVHLYDEDGNYIGPIDEEGCCEDYTATLDEGSSASMKSEGYWWDDNRIVIVNELLPGETTLTVHCIGNNIPDLVQTVEFLQPVSRLEVTSDAEVIYDCDGATVNIDAQIIGPLDNPIDMPRVEVTLYVDNHEHDMVRTDENGTAHFVGVHTFGSEVGEDVKFRAEAECREGTLELPVIEGPADMTVTGDADYMVTNDSCSDPDSTAVTVQLLNDSGLPFMVAGMNMSMILNDDYTNRAYYETDENGTVMFDVEGTPEPSSLHIYVYMVDCELANYTEIEVVEAILDVLVLEPVEPIYDPFCVGDVQGVEVSGLNTTRDMVMCLEECDYEFGVENDTVAFWNGTYTYDGLDRRIRNNLTANATGTTTVNVTCDDVTTGDIEVVVVNPEPACTNVVITTEDPVDVVIGDTVTFAASCTDQFGDPFTCTDLTWNSDNETVGTMGSPTLTALAPGITNITATGCGDSNSIQVNVTGGEDPIDRYDANGNGYIDRDELKTAIYDYLTQPIGTVISRDDLKTLIYDYLDNLP